MSMNCIKCKNEIVNCKCEDTKIPINNIMEQEYWLIKDRALYGNAYFMCIESQIYRFNPRYVEIIFEN